MSNKSNLAYSLLSQARRLSVECEMENRPPCNFIVTKDELSALVDTFAHYTFDNRERDDTICGLKIVVMEHD